MSALAWDKRVSPIFRARVIDIASKLRVDPSWLMACMAFETGESFSPSIRNAAGSGAVGLIQFMPSTCAALGTSVEQIAALSAEDQLAYVEKYFKPWARKMADLADVYAVILWPSMIGKLPDSVIFDKADPKRPALYAQNKGLDFNKDGKITKAEIVSKVQAKLDKGLRPENASTI